jgi:hypothetical protein
MLSRAASRGLTALKERQGKGTSNRISKRLEKKQGNV